MEDFSCKAVRRSMWDYVAGILDEKDRHGDPEPMQVDIDASPHVKGEVVKARCLVSAAMHMGHGILIVLTITLELTFVNEICTSIFCDAFTIRMSNNNIR